MYIYILTLCRTICPTYVVYVVNNKTKGHKNESVA